MRLHRLIVISVLFCLLVNKSLAANDLDIPPAYVSMASRYQIPPEVLYALALTESGTQHEDRHRPWPWTINVNGKGSFYESYEAATEAANDWISSGVRNLDIGLMQINWRVHSHRFENIEQAFDPYINLAAGAQILKIFFNEMEKDWLKAIGRYRSKTKRFAEEHQTRFAINLTNLVLKNAK